MFKLKPTVNKALPYILIISGVIGYISAFIIMFDKVQILHDPHYVPSCNLNPIISCGSVMQSKQATAFGFPNPFLGLGGFPVLAFLGLAMLAGGKFKRWLWRIVQVAVVFGVGFVHWLFFESVYRIHALCPYCMAVWVVMITTFWYVTLYNFDNQNLPLGGSPARKAYGWVRRHHLDLLLLWFLVIAGLILKHFWYYFGKHLF